MSRLPPFQSRLTISLPIRLLVMLAAAGCGDPAEGPPTVPVLGVLRVDGRPAVGAQVILHPADQTDFDRRGTRPTGRVGRDGVYTLTTYRPGDGAPAGRYVVTVYWAENLESLEPSPDRLRGKYLDPARSSLAVEVDNVDTQLPAFDLPLK